MRESSLLKGTVSIKNLHFGICISAPEFPIRLTAIGAPVLAGVVSIKGDCLYQEPSFRYLHFSSGSFPHGIRPLFPFRRPMKPAAAILGGSSIRMWMWPGHTSASMTLSLFQSHNVLRILPISLLFSPKNTFRLYFAANTTRYLHFNSYAINYLRRSLLNNLPLPVCAVGRPHFLFSKGIFSFS